MGAPELTFVNNNPPQCGEGSLNAFTQELNNVITGMGFAINDSNYSQMIEAILKGISSGTFYDYSGTANAIILTRVASIGAVATYYDGMRAAFVATNVNTGAATVNVSGLGVKDIRRSDGSTLSPQDISGFTEIVYRSGVDYFIVTSTAAVSQIAQYDSSRVYYYGDIVYTIDGITNQRRYWQWYSNQEELSGIDPTDTANRRPGWSDTTKPWYWNPYIPNTPGETMYWDNDTLPELMVVAQGQQLPKVVYHRLFDAHPDWEDGTDPSLINIPDRQGRFTRGADGATYLTGATHEDAIRDMTGYADQVQSKVNALNSTGVFTWTYQQGGNSSGSNYAGRLTFTASNVVPTAAENQPKGYIEWVGYAL